MIRTRMKSSKTTAAEEPPSSLSTGRTAGSLLRRARAVSSSDMASSLARSGTAVKVASSQTFFKFFTVETVALGQAKVRTSKICAGRWEPFDWLKGAMRKLQAMRSVSKLKCPFFSRVGQDVVGFEPALVATGPEELV